MPPRSKHVTEETERVKTREKECFRLYLYTSQNNIIKCIYLLAYKEILY